MKKYIISLFSILLLTPLAVGNVSAVVQEEQYKYTIQDAVNLQDFLLAKPTDEDLTGKPYDLNGDDGSVQTADFKRNRPSQEEIHRGNRTT